MNREELAEKIARLLNPGEWWDKDPHPADRAMWMQKGRAIADELWPVLEQVWDDGNDAGFAFGNGQPLNTPNPYREIH